MYETDYGKQKTTGCLRVII